jgi:hypothetical protein
MKDGSPSSNGEGKQPWVNICWAYISFLSASLEEQSGIGLPQVH